MDPLDLPDQHVLADPAPDADGLELLRQFDRLFAPLSVSGVNPEQHLPL